MPIQGVDPAEVEGLWQRARDREIQEKLDAGQRANETMRWTRITGWVSIVALVIAIIALLRTG